MILLRARPFGQPEWTTISINGPFERGAFSMAGAGLASGNLHVQYMDEEGDWVDISELEWDEPGQDEEEGA